MTRGRMPDAEDTQNQPGCGREYQGPQQRGGEERNCLRFPGHDFLLSVFSEALRDFSRVSILSARRRSSVLSTTRWSTIPVNSSSSEPRQKLRRALRTASAATLRGSRELE